MLVPLELLLCLSEQSLVLVSPGPVWVGEGAIESPLTSSI